MSRPRSGWDTVFRGTRRKEVEVDSWTILRRDGALALGDFLERIAKRVGGGWRITQIVVKYENKD